MAREYCFLAEAMGREEPCIYNCDQFCMRRRRKRKGGYSLLNTAQFILNLADLGAGAVDTTPLSHDGSTVSFTRATVAWTKLASGLWASVASGTARSVYTGATTAVGTYAGYFAEQAATQLVTPDASIRDMTSSWTATNITAAKTGTGIDGVANSCTRLTCTSNGGKITQTLTAAASSRTYSVWLLRVTGTGTVGIFQDDGSTVTDVTSSINSSTFTRVELNASQLNAVFGITMGTSGDVILADFNQFEAGLDATSPMATAGAARNADQLTYTGAEDYGATGSAYCEVTPFSVAAITRSWFEVSDGSGNERCQFLAASATPTNISNSVTDGGVAQANVAVASVLAVNTQTKAASAWMTNSVNMAANGTLGIEDTSCTMPTTNAIRIAHSVTASRQTNGGIKNVRIWNTTRSRADLQKLTGE